MSDMHDDTLEISYKGVLFLFACQKLDNSFIFPRVFGGSKRRHPQIVYGELKDKSLLIAVQECGDDIQ